MRRPLLVVVDVAVFGEMVSRRSGCYKSQERRSMYGFVTIVFLIAVVGWVRDQTLRDLQQIRRDWREQRL